MTTKQPPKPSAPTRGEILLVDDNPANLQLLSTILMENGYQVQPATSGAKALALIQTSPPDLILLDIKIPEMNGYELCQHLKANPTTQAIPIIFLSAMDGTLDKVRAFSVGGSDYIPRPFEIEEVLARIENQVSRRHLQQELQQVNDDLEQGVASRTEVLSQTIERLEEEVAERQRAEEALQQYTSRLGGLHQIDRAILAAASTEAIAQAAVVHLPNLISCQWIGMMRFDFESEEAILLAIESDGSVDLQVGQKIPLEGLHRLVELGQGQPVVENISRSNRRDELEERLFAGGVRSCIQAPLMLRDHLLGCLCLGVDTAGAFTVEHPAIAEEVATQMALALENMRLQEETQRRTKGLAALNKASRAMASTLELNTVLKQTMEELKALLGAEGASILLHDPANEDLVFTTVIAAEAGILTGMHVPLNEGIAGWVMQKQEPVLVEDVQTDPRFYNQIDTVTGLTTRTLLAVPLAYKDEVKGVVEVINKKEGHFRQHDLEMLEALTSSAVIAIENARLYENLQDRMQALQTTQQQLIQSEKMAAMGRLLASITHEINNPLQSVQTCLTLTKEEMEGEQRGEKIDRYLGIVESEIERVSTIVQRMRDFYRPGAQQGFQPTDLSTMVESVLELTGKQLQNSEIVVEQTWPPDLSPVEANGDHLKQVFLNLILNAIDAMPGGGRLQIEARQSDTQPTIQLTFKDNGKGMPAETLVNIFEPFFTTKATGSGLGLSISYGIIEAHQGHITAKSQPKRGTTFTIVLPLHQPEVGYDG